MTWSLLKRRKLGQGRKRRHFGGSFRPAVEELEDRRLLAYGISLSGDEVAFLGDTSADTLTLSVDSAGNLAHDLPLGGNLASAIDLDTNLPGEQSRNVGSITGLTINDPGENDTLAISGAATFYFRPLKTLQVSVGEIRVSAPITVEESGEVTLSATRSIVLGDQSLIQTMEGDITLTAHQGADPIDADFIGITLDGAVISSHSGDIELRGAGGDRAGGSLNRGVYLAGGSIIESTGSGPATGTITIAGRGGEGGGSNRGVQLDEAGTTIRSVDGEIRIIGQGGQNSTNVFSQGVLLSHGMIESRGEGANAAEIIIEGSGGNAGVFISSEMSVESTDGDIQISGVGGEMAGGANRGVVLNNGAVVKSMGTGPEAATITIVGTGRNAGDRNRGVQLHSEGTAVLSVDGDVQITGNGGDGDGSFNQGVILREGLVESTGVGAEAATITIDGTGGNGAGEDVGVFLLDNVAIRSIDGEVRLAGQGGSGGGNYNRGVVIADGALVESTGTGTDAATITVTGAGGDAAAGNRGVQFHGENVAVRSIDGDIEITGEGGAGSGGYNHGIVIFRGAITSTGTGPNAADISFHGIGGNGTASDIGIDLNSADARVTSVDGAIHLTGQGRTDDNESHGFQIAAGGEVRRTGTSGGTATVTVLPDDSVDFSNEWSLSGTMIENAVFYRVIEKSEGEPFAALLLEGSPNWQNPVNHLDIDANETISPLDMLIIVNVLNGAVNEQLVDETRQYVDPLSVSDFPDLFPDTNGDNFATPIDVLIIVNALNSSVGASEGESHGRDHGSRDRAGVEFHRDLRSAVFASLPFNTRDRVAIDTYLADEIPVEFRMTRARTEWRPGEDDLFNARTRDEGFSGNTGEPTEPDDMEELLEAIASARGLLQDPETSIAA